MFWSPSDSHSRKDTGSRRERRKQAPALHAELLMQTWLRSINQDSLTDSPGVFQATLPCLTMQLSSTHSAVASQRWLAAPGAGCPAAGGFGLSRVMASCVLLAPGPQKLKRSSCSMPPLSGLFQSVGDRHCA